MRFCSSWLTEEQFIRIFFAHPNHTHTYDIIRHRKFAGSHSFFFQNGWLQLNPTAFLYDECVFHFTLWNLIAFLLPMIVCGSYKIMSIIWQRMTIFFLFRSRTATRSTVLLIELYAYIHIMCSSKEHWSFYLFFFHRVYWYWIKKQNVGKKIKRPM